jgi:geranylgeranyl pyrophosphate synthase
MTTAATEFDMKKYFAQQLPKVEAALAESIDVLPREWKYDSQAETVIESMRYYALMAGGRRIRPYLLYYEDQALLALLVQKSQAETVMESMRYALMTGGRTIGPYLLYLLYLLYHTSTKVNAVRTDGGGEEDQALLALLVQTYKY